MRSSVTSITAGAGSGMGRRRAGLMAALLMGLALGLLLGAPGATRSAAAAGRPAAAPPNAPGPQLTAPNSPRNSGVAAVAGLVLLGGLVAAHVRVLRAASRAAASPSSTAVEGAQPPAHGERR